MASNPTPVPATLGKQDLARALSRQTGISNTVALNVMDRLIAILSDQLAAGGRIELANFLTLSVSLQTRVTISDQSSDSADIHKPIGDSRFLFNEQVTRFAVLKCRPGKRLRTRLQALAARPDNP